jgi:hypothetical protein
MATKTIEDAPRFYARVAGVIYLLVIVFGGFFEGYVMDKVVVSGDIITTAHNIAASSDLWRISVAGNLIVPMIAIVQLWIEYMLLKPVSKNGALLFLLLNLASLAVESVSKVFLLMIAPMLSAAGFSRGLDTHERQSLAVFAFSAHNISFNITLLLFGLACLVLGHLIFWSRYLPKAIGVLIQIAGACYLTASFSELFFPRLANFLTPWILLPALLGESSLCLWLLVVGVNVKRWNERLRPHRAT